MPDCEDLKQQDGEDDDDYIARLKSCLLELLKKHIAENKGKPLFASDIKDEDKSKEENKRRNWKSRQLKQWNARHEILREIVEVRKRTNKKILGEIPEEISIEDFIPYLGNSDSLKQSRFGLAYNLEIRQRWLTEDGKAFLKKITSGLQKEENLWEPDVPEEQNGLDFSDVTIDGGRKFADFYYVHETEKRKYRDLRCANLQRAGLWAANLQGASLMEANLQGAALWLANLQGAGLRGANLQRAGLRNAELQGAVLSKAKLQRADLWHAKLQGANFNYSVIAGPALRRVDIGTGDAEREIDDRSADFDDVEFSREWRGPRWTAPIAWALHLGNKELAWWKLETIEEKETGKNRIIRLLKSIKRKWNEFLESPRWYSGRPTTFFGVDTSRMDASKNPGLKRYIEDEQYIEDFKEEHRVIYWFWAMSSDCGRCLSLWAFWSLVFATVFAVIYTIFPWMIYVDNVHTELPHPHFLTNLYFSIITFTTLGFGDVQANNLWGAMVIGLEVVLGYFFLGGLVAILASKLARRA